MIGGLAFMPAVLGALIAGSTVAQTAFMVSGAACELGEDSGDGLRTTYWDLLQLTEVCARVGTDTPALSLSFVLVYAGRPPAGSLRPEAKGKPNQVLLTVRSTAPELVIVPRFTIAADGRRLDLAAADRPHQILYPCDQCAYDGVASELELAELLGLARAAHVAGNAMGSEFVLTPAGHEAVRRIAARASLR